MIVCLMCLCMVVVIRILWCLVRLCCVVLVVDL